MLFNGFQFYMVNQKIINCVTLKSITYKVKNENKGVGRP